MSRSERGVTAILIMTTPIMVGTPACALHADREPGPQNPIKRSVCFYGGTTSASSVSMEDDLPALRCYAVIGRAVHYRKEAIMRIAGDNFN